MTHLRPFDFATTFADAVARNANLPAFHHVGLRSLTYAELGEVVDDKVASYRAAGIDSSAAIGVIADDLAEFLTDVFALLKLQAFALLLPADTTPWELSRLSGNIALSHVIAAGDIGAHAATIGRRRVTESSDRRTSPCLSGAVGLLTSGTTGRQKIALRTAAAMLAEATAMRHELGFTPGRRLATLVPLHHAYGFGDCALAGILAGAEVRCYPRMPASAYLAELERAHIETVALVPPQLQLLAEACQTPRFRDLAVLSAGAPLGTRTAELAERRLGCIVGRVFGTTETGVVAVSPPGTSSDTTVGRPCHHVELRLRSLPPEWESADADAEGVVTVRTRALLEGYVTLDGIDRQCIEHGWFSTGDCARWVDGRLQLLGRLSAAINVAGVKVSAEEIEAALMEFPGVRSALVTGVADAMTHQRIRASVSPADVDLDALRAFCEQRLSPPKRPHYYEATAAVATTPSGKVIRAAQ